MIDEFKYFNRYERRLINFLYRVRTSRSTRYLADRLGMHWTTVRTNLRRLHGRGWVIRKRLRNKTNWKFNFAKYHQLKKKAKPKKRLIRKY